MGAQGGGGEERREEREEETRDGRRRWRGYGKDIMKLDCSQDNSPPHLPPSLSSPESPSEIRDEVYP